MRPADSGWILHRCRDGDQPDHLGRLLSGLCRPDHLDHLPDAQPWPPDRPDVFRVRVL